MGMFRNILGLGEVIFDNEISDDEMYEEGCKVFAEMGFNNLDKLEDDKDFIILAYAERECKEGRARTCLEATLVDSKTGEKFKGKKVYAYDSESYEEALKRELDESGESYDSDDILKSAIE